MHIHRGGEEEEFQALFSSLPHLFLTLDFKVRKVRI
jgi:hypothetical protein